MSDDGPELAGNEAPDFSSLDDSALITRRREIREELEREPPNMADLVRVHYLMTTEVLRRTITLRKKPN